MTLYLIVGIKFEHVAVCSASLSLAAVSPVLSTNQRAARDSGPGDWPIGVEQRIKLKLSLIVNITKIIRIYQD